MNMMIITKAIRKQLLINGASDLLAIAKDGNTKDHIPVLKLFTPWGACTWLLTSMYPDNEDLLFGLSDLGMDEVAFGDIYLPELVAITGPFGLKIERDRGFHTTIPISVYAAEGREKGRLVA